MASTDESVEMKSSQHATLDSNIGKSIKADLSDTKSDGKAKSSRSTSIGRTLQHMIIRAPKTEADVIPPPFQTCTFGMRDIAQAIKQNTKHLNKLNDHSWIRARSADSIQSSSPSENALVLGAKPDPRVRDCSTNPSNRYATAEWKFNDTDIETRRNAFGDQTISNTLGSSSYQDRKRKVMDCTVTETGTATVTNTVTTDNTRPYILPAYSGGISSLEQSSWTGQGNSQPPPGSETKQRPQEAYDSEQREEGAQLTTCAPGTRPCKLKRYYTDSYY